MKLVKVMVHSSNFRQVTYHIMAFELTCIVKRRFQSTSFSKELVTGQPLRDSFLIKAK